MADSCGLSDQIRLIRKLTTRFQGPFCAKRALILHILLQLQLHQNPIIGVLKLDVMQSKLESTDRVSGASPSISRILISFFHFVQLRFVGDKSERSRDHCGFAMTDLNALKRGGFLCFVSLGVQRNEGIVMRVSTGQDLRNNFFGSFLFPLMKKKQKIQAKNLFDDPLRPCLLKNLELLLPSVVVRQQILLTEPSNDGSPTNKLKAD